MHRISDIYKSLVILPLPFSGRLPLDIILVTPYESAHTAKINDHVRYFTGRPCKQGHLSDRYVTSSNCVECHASLSSPRGERPKDLPVADLPKCLAANAGAKFCRGCEHEANCSGSIKYQVTPLRRAVYTFHDFAPVTAEHARAVGLAVYMPAEPCEVCHTRSWRKLGGSRCSVCEVRDMRREMGMADAETWLPPVSKSVPTNLTLPTNREVWHAAIRARQSTFTPVVPCPNHPDSAFSTGHNSCVACKERTFGEEYADSIREGWQPEWDRDPVIRRVLDGS